MDEVARGVDWMRKAVAFTFEAVGNDEGVWKRAGGHVHTWLCMCGCFRHCKNSDQVSVL
jgi:hypothetical protein